MSTTFYVLILLPSVAFAFLVLTTFYGERCAYFAISWAPVSFSLLLSVLGGLAYFGESAGGWLEDLACAITWISLVQCSLGLVLTIKAYRQGSRWFALLLAAFLAGVPFLSGL
jgi:hypothetical protein